MRPTVLMPVPPSGEASLMETGVTLSLADYAILQARAAEGAEVSSLRAALDASERIIASLTRHVEAFGQRAAAAVLCAVLVLSGAQAVAQDVVAQVQTIGPPYVVTHDDGAQVFRVAQAPQLPEAVYQTLVEVCAAYPWATVQSDRHLGEILNAVAWRHRAEGWGLSRKTGGRHVDSPVGLIAEDILQLPDGHHFDVLDGAGHGLPLRPGRATSIGVIDLRARPWVAPVDAPLSWATTPGPSPSPKPPVVTPPPAQTDLTEVLVALSRIEARLADLEQRPPDHALLSAYIDDMVGKGPAGDPALMPNHITDLKQRIDVVRVQVEQLTAWLRSRRALGF